MDPMTETGAANDQFVTMTANIVSAFAGSQNKIDPESLPGMIKTIHSTLVELAAPAAPAEEAKQEPFTTVRKSVQPDYLVCLEDGAKLKMLKRYLRQKFNLTPDEYRAKWGLPKDYPMVCPNYAAARRELAKSIGLGTSRTRSGRGGGAAADARAEKKNAEGKADAKKADPKKAEAGKTAPAPRQRKKADPKAANATPARRGRPPKNAAPKGEEQAAANA